MNIGKTTLIAIVVMTLSVAGIISSIKLIENDGDIIGALVLIITSLLAVHLTSSSIDKLK